MTNRWAEVKIIGHARVLHMTPEDKARQPGPNGH